MAVSEVPGLECFKEYMRGCEDCYAVIGGAACDILLSDADLPFRATKDIDLILLADNRLPMVGAAVWRLVRDGSYTCGWKSSGDVHLYRFTEPRVPGFPAMIELFGNAPAFIQDATGLTIVPVPMDGYVSSLSAILLDPHYYAFAREGRKVLGGVAVLDAIHLIPFKVKAHLDLSERHSRGEHVNARDLKKHKNDVARLAQLIRADDMAELDVGMRSDMEAFLASVCFDEVGMRNMEVPLTDAEIKTELRRVYGLR